MTQLSLIDIEETRRIPVLSPFVGGKGSTKYAAIHDGNTYDCTLEMFLGGGGFTLLHASAPRNLIAADADPAVRAAWRAWQDTAMREIASRQIERWCQRFQGVNIDEAKAAWRHLCEEFNWQGNPALKQRPRDRIAHFAAASIVIRRLCFGTVVRMNTKGRLNIALSKDKHEAFSNWQHQWPTPLNATTIAPHYNLAALTLKRSNYQNVLAVIDPPYWVPYKPGTKRRGTGAMTAAYPGHKPSSDGLFYDCINAIDAALSTGKVKRAVVFNYYSPKLDQAIRVAAKRHDMPCHFSNLGPLGNMNNAQQKHGRFDEGVWEIGDRHCFRDIPISSVETSEIKELPLFEVA